MIFHYDACIFMGKPLSFQVLLHKLLLHKYHHLPCDNQQDNTLQNLHFQNKLFVTQRIEIEFEDMKIVGKITNINYIDQIIDVETAEGTLYIPLHRGLPKEIVSIKAIHVKEKEPDQPDELEIDDGILNIIEEDVEEDEFYYSIEQQKNDFLENLLMYIPVKERTPKKLKELNKMIQRYVELRTKYTTFSDGVYINHLQIEQIFATTVALENKLYVRAQYIFARKFYLCCWCKNKILCKYSNINF
jgi:hypothetical protein